MESFTKKTELEEKNTLQNVVPPEKTGIKSNTGAEIDCMPTLNTERQHSAKRTSDEENAESMKQAHRLTTEQLYMFDYQLYTPMSTMYNLFIMMKFGIGMFDLSKLTKAIEAAIHSHPAMLTKFSFNENGEIVQVYDESLMPELCVEEISEFDLNKLKDTLVQPFKIINSRLFRSRIFKTEKAVYLFFDFHHTIFDGISFKVLMSSIARAYKGASLKQDHYYLALKNREEIALTPFYEESRRYFEEHYNGNDWISFPPVDYITRENEYGQLDCKIEIDTAKLRDLEKKYEISRNEFFIVVSALAVSLYADNPNVKLSWIHNGRKSFRMMNIVGLLYRDLPVAFRFGKSRKIGDAFIDAHEQVQKAIEYSCYPYIENNAQVVENDVAAVLYQRDIRDVTELGGVAAETVELKQNRAASQNILDIEVLDGADGLQLSLDYASSRYELSSMEKFRDLFIRIAAILVRNAEGDITVGELCKEMWK